jgi:nicotinamide riboside kinase
MAHWDELLPPVRPYYLKRVCVCDFEKSGLADRLAAHFRTVCAHAYEPGVIGCEALMRAIRGQMAAEDGLARQANRVLICAADAVTLAALAESSLASCPDEIGTAAGRRHSDLYLLAESADDLPDDGRIRRDRLAAMLAARELPLIRLHGPPDAQLRQAREAVDAVLRPRPR